MIEVAVLDVKGQVKALKFNTTVLQVIDGSLIILREDHATFIAGFAPGRWLNFQIVEE